MQKGQNLLKRQSGLGLRLSSGVGAAEGERRREGGRTVAAAGHWTLDNWTLLCSALLCSLLRTQLAIDDIHFRLCSQSCLALSSLSA